MELEAVPKDAVRAEPLASGYDPDSVASLPPGQYYE